MSILPLLLDFADHQFDDDDDAFGCKVCPGQITLPRCRRPQSLNTCLRPIFKRQLQPKPRYHRNNCTRLSNLNSNFGKDGFQVAIDTKDFGPDEITVKTIDNMVIVEGKHEEKEDGHGHISRHFVRKYTLPKEVDVNDIISTRSSDGLLTVKAPPKAKGELSAERLIKIQQTCEVHQPEKGKKIEKVANEEKMAE